jgi:hypothetical protein
MDPLSPGTNELVSKAEGCRAGPLARIHSLSMPPGCSEHDKQNCFLGLPSPILRWKKTAAVQTGAPRGCDCSLTQSKPCSLNKLRVSVWRRWDPKEKPSVPGEKRERRWTSREGEDMHNNLYSVLTLAVCPFYKQPLIQTWQ